MNETNWQDVFINDIPRESNEYFLMLNLSKNSVSPILYKVVNGEIEHSNDLNTQVFNKYLNYWQAMTEYGLHIYQYINHSLNEHKLITHYNFELSNKSLCELTLFQEYNLYPANDTGKKELTNSIKAEKIKDTLVYACYLNDTDKIMSCLEKANKGQLNKKLQYVGTPLGICAQNNNLEAFIAIAEKGADINKASLAYRPLKIAFQYSPDIVKYIYEHHKDQFMKEVNQEGFSIACQTTDISLLEILRDLGCDMIGNKKPFPPLLNFADYNNIVGIQFLHDNGAKMDVVNNHGQTALDRAKKQGNVEAIDLLMKLLNK